MTHREVPAASANDRNDEPHTGFSIRAGFRRDPDPGRDLGDIFDGYLHLSPKNTATAIIGLVTIVGIIFLVLAFFHPVG